MESINGTWLNEIYLKIIITCTFGIIITLCSCTTTPKWVQSDTQLTPYFYSYLPERSDISPLVINHLRQSLDQQKLAALECIASNPIDIVVTGARESPEFRDLLLQVFAEFKTGRKECIPLSGEWEIITLRNLNEQHWGGGEAGAGIAATWVTLCLYSLGIACPVYKSFHFKLVTCVLIPNSEPEQLEGNGHADEWAVMAWSYKNIRDEALANAISDALMEMTIQYSNLLHQQGNNVSKDLK